MRRDEAQDYEKRIRGIVYLEGVDALIRDIDPKVLRKLIVCKDYRNNSATKVSRLHSNEEQKVSVHLVYRWCGKKVV